MKNRKGLSAVVIALILILLALAAISIVWVVVNNIIKSGTKNADITAKCLNVNVEATASTCAAGVCDIIIMRTGTEDDAIAGVKLVFRDSTAGTSSAVIDEAGNIEALAGKSVNVDTGLTAPDSVEVTAYFEDASGNKQLCGLTTTFEF
ncbi:hypothetical protein A3K82_01400 [Candidatus Pacearchaeota archaeon RBG_19FT_COMBO_34_9]|nr:MAG: hypothetical protein A3K82_01400 [Candidatus Pacearchaeota archaeon RBG_19FT_COMBO_34_9]OGJ16923.1 MAG: hypothetical protein A3K74_02190 [Candidatus Pacearchaeota archaeon RBG_13_33_26]